jgi:hypothetical protein
VKLLSMLSILFPLHSSRLPNNLGKGVLILQKKFPYRLSDQPGTHSCSVAELRFDSRSSCAAHHSVLPFPCTSRNPFTLPGLVRFLGRIGNFFLCSWLLRPWIHAYAWPCQEPVLLCTPSSHPKHPFLVCLWGHPHFVDGLALYCGERQRQCLA